MKSDVDCAGKKWQEKKWYLVFCLLALGPILSSCSSRFSQGDAKDLVKEPVGASLVYHGIEVPSQFVTVTDIAIDQVKLLSDDKRPMYGFSGQGTLTLNVSGDEIAAAAESNVGATARNLDWGNMDGAVFGMIRAKKAFENVPRGTRFHVWFTAAAVGTPDGWKLAHFDPDPASIETGTAPLRDATPSAVSANVQPDKGNANPAPEASAVAPPSDKAADAADQPVDAADQAVDAARSAGDSTLVPSQAEAQTSNIALDATRSEQPAGSSEETPPTGPATAVRSNLPDTPATIVGAAVTPRYPPQALRNHVEGTAMVAMIVGKDGSVVDASIQRSSGHSELDRAALEAVQRWHFKPATRAGVPVASGAAYPVKFSLSSLDAPELADSVQPDAPQQRTPAQPLQANCGTSDVGGSACLGDQIPEVDSRPAPLPPDFECRTAAANSESSICADGRLAEAERDAQAMTSRVQTESPSEQIRQMASPATHSGWVAQRNKSCDRDVNCLISETQNRTRYLRSLIGLIGD